MGPRVQEAANAMLYSPLVLTVLAIRRVVTACAVAATLALSVLPAEHVHESDSGRPLVHRHAVEDAAEHARTEHAGTVDHGDHHAVGTADATFVAERQHDLERPAVTVIPPLVAPERRLVGHVALLDDPVAHGPPIRVGSPRAPPA
jgi:hypothetical protein